LWRGHAIEDEAAFCAFEELWNAAEVTPYPHSFVIVDAWPSGP